MRRIVVFAALALGAVGFAQAQTTRAPKPTPATETTVPAATPQTPPVERLAPASTITTTMPVQLSTMGLRELSPWSMFLNADILVKAVMIGLAFASLITWTIFVAKSIEMATARRRLSRALKQAGTAGSLAEAQIALGRESGVLQAFLAAALTETKLSAGSPVENGIKERAASSFAEITRAESRAARRGMGVLATIGATAPFVGLFGTVWGIMNSFIGISKAQTTNLAVVAPGIAEALLATAIGLVAAIPAVVIYNHFSRQTRGYLDLVNRGAGAVGRLLSRDLDMRFGRGNSHAAE